MLDTLAKITIAVVFEDGFLPNGKRIMWVPAKDGNGEIGIVFDDDAAKISADAPYQKLLDYYLST